MTKRPTWLDGWWEYQILSYYDTCYAGFEFSFKPGISVVFQLTFIWWVQYITGSIQSNLRSSLFNVSEQCNQHLVICCGTGAESKSDYER